jgi:hypothetical protein
MVTSMVNLMAKLTVTPMVHLLLGYLKAKMLMDCLKVNQLDLLMELMILANLKANQLVYLLDWSLAKMRLAMNLVNLSGLPKESTKLVNLKETHLVYLLD